MAKKSFTAFYTPEYPNFCIYHLRQKTPLQTDFLSAFYVIKNLLQRGNPTPMSRFLKQHVLLEDNVTPNQIIRFQILILELLIHGYLQVHDKSWNLAISYTNENKNFVYLAFEDLFLWFENLFQLRKLPFQKPKLNIVWNNEYGTHESYVKIDIDFENHEVPSIDSNSEIIYLRKHHDQKTHFFQIHTTQPVTYPIISDDELDRNALRFFLNNLFDKEDFRDGQYPIIVSVLQRKDTIGLLPTGAGKSLCYQLPSLLQPCIHFVVCPIKSLMYDQKENLDSIGVTQTAVISSDFSYDEKQIIQQNFASGKYFFLWLSPERFQNKEFRNYLQNIYLNWQIGYAVIDEVHCMSEWGHDFRTSYLNLIKTIHKFCKDVNLIGLTATASVNVLKDIKAEFGISDSNIKTLLDYSRKELYFEVVNDRGNKWDQLIKKIKILKEKENFLEDNHAEAALIFTPHVNHTYGCYNVSKRLATELGCEVGWFSGEVPSVKNLSGWREPIMHQVEFEEYKINIQKAFKRNEFPIMVATKAFGMGIDKPNIYYTFHYGIPASVEALYQEAGRAGRWDKNDPKYKNHQAKCYVLYSPEIIGKKYLKELFDVNTTSKRLKNLNEIVKWDGRDIFRMVFLFAQNLNDIEEDFQSIEKVIKNFYHVHQVVKIPRSFLSNYVLLEKVIYRLSILGIVKDWTTDFVEYFEVEFGEMKEETVLENLQNYIRKYEAFADVKKLTENYKIENPIERYIWFLLKWTWENIIYNRKQALKTISEWCDDFQDSESFKKRIEAYFQFTETTFVLQHIAENPYDYEQWFTVFYENQQFINKTELLQLKDRISRFLESYRNNMGLNIISGFVRLFLDDFYDADGKQRFENALKNIRQVFPENEHTLIIEKMLEIVFNLSNDELKKQFGLSVLQFFPNQVEYLAYQLGIEDLLIEGLSKRLLKLKQINRKHYEQVAKIR